MLIEYHNIAGWRWIQYNNFEVAYIILVCYPFFAAKAQLCIRLSFGSASRSKQFIRISNNFLAHKQEKIGFIEQAYNFKIAMRKVGLNNCSLAT